MTTAPIENRGGANGGPQYNPANVSGTGGAGQSGNYSGFAYGMNKEINESRVEGNRAMATTQAGNIAPAASALNVSAITPLSAPTESPDIPVTDGAALGDGAGMEALNLPGTQDTDTDKQRLLSYLPALEIAAESPTSSQAFRNYVRLIKANLA